MIFYPRVCVNCHEEFEPIEGNDTRDFCSWGCEDEYYRYDPDVEEYVQTYGRNPFH
jgi:hypothetical protein